MGILSGVVSYLFGLALNLLDVVIDGFLGALGFDIDQFESYFPAASDYHEVIIGFGVALLFIMLIFQIFRNFGIVLDMEAEDPLKMLGKTALFFGMIIYSRSITNLILGLLVDPYAIFTNAASAPYEFKLMTIVTAMFTSVWTNPFLSIVALIMWLVLGWQLLKLVVECAERYVVFYFCIYCAPVVFSTGAFKSTAQIFKSWCRMLGSQAILLLLNIWSIKLFMSFIPVMENDADNLIVHFIIGYAFLKFAQKADTLLRILGLNTASTGDMVRSLGGTIAGIAHAFRGAAGAASKVAGGVSKLFGGGAQDSPATPGTGGGNNGGGISGISGGGGTSPNAPSNLSGSGEAASSTASGISSGKQNFANEVLSSAKSQLQGMGKGDGSASTASEDGVNETISAHGGEGSAEDNVRMAQSGVDGELQGGGRDGDNIRMGGKDADGDKPKTHQQRIDADTMEGLSNIAHGLPHDKYDPIKKSWSGGGFKEFTGEEANIIGASQLTPNDGISQSTTKMADGTTGTVYRNDETGEAQMVQFSSVDNGVMQGTMREIDPNTGSLGEDFHFKAVHESVPGAQAFSSNAVPVKDAEGGSYYVATGGNTSFFAPGGSNTMNSASGGTTGAAASPGNPAAAPAAPINSVGGGQTSYTPGGTSTMHGAAGPAPAGTPVSGASGIGASGVESSVRGETAHMPGATVGDSGVTVPGPSGTGDPSSGVGDSISNHTTSVHEGNTVNNLHTAAPTGAAGAGNPIPGGAVGTQGGGTLDSAAPTGPSASSPPINSGIRKPQNPAGRFSKSNPANVEIFSRGGSNNVESFNRSSASQPDSVPRMNGPGE